MSFSQTRIRRVLSCACGLLLLTTLSGPASATLIFEWMGTCSFGCTGTSTALVTTTDAYVPGTSITSSTMVSFEYTGSNGTVSIPGDGSFFIPAGDPLIIPATPGPSTDFQLDFAGDDTYFCAPDGSNILVCNNTGWHLVFSPKGFGEGNLNDPGVWRQQVPEPTTLLLMGLGLAGLGFARRRKLNA